MKFAAVLFIFGFLSLPLSAQTSDPDSLTRIKVLIADEDWHEVVRSAEAETSPSAEVNYFYGIALARLERWDDAKIAFEYGRSQQPDDKRFPIELAGISFRQKKYREAAGYLRRALRIDPEDKYANDFLGSVYFLQGNIEAALKYWNRVSKPHIEQVQADPSPKVDEVLLDRAFEFAPASVLKLSEFQTTEARVGGLGIFPYKKFDLNARTDGSFDVVFRARERNGFGANKWQALVSLFRGLPFQTVSPEYYNIGGRATNIVSLIRWDAQKRRFWANLSSPLSGNPKRRYSLDLDLRDENWEVRDFSHGATQPVGLKLQKEAIAASVTSFESGRWNWSTGVEVSHRRILDFDSGAGLGPQFLTGGFQLKHLGQLNYVLARVPERRVVVKSGVSTQLGRTWSKPSKAFAKLQASIETQWLPQAIGDDYEMQGKVRVGWTLGQIPFDELFVLGVERDNDLWLRAHSGTRNGQKGNAPMGRNYFLSNWEVDKNVFDRSLIKIKLGPFLDVGRITDDSIGTGSNEWLWDVGAQAKVVVLGQQIRFSYGRDLRSGGDVFYVTFR